MEKAKYLKVWTEAPSASERPQNNWLCVCVFVHMYACVSEGHSLLEFHYNSFKYLLLECKFSWKLRSLLWKSQTITYHGYCHSAEYPSSFWRNKKIWLYKQVTVLNYKSGAGGKNKNLLTAGWTTPCLRVNWSSADLARSRSNIKMNWLQIVEIVQHAHLEYAALRMALFSDGLTLFWM